MNKVLDLNQPLALLGGLSAQQFMTDYWHKKPLLIRQALPNAASLVSQRDLLTLAAQDHVESRLIVQQAARGKRGTRSEWSLQHGPFQPQSLPPFTQKQWTLLVQGVDLHVPRAHRLLSEFRFVPAVRLDDIMVSLATDGGGVGPHFDSYDVFLLQVQGKRHWRIGQLTQPELQPNVPLKILTNFVAEEEWTLEPGDMLYLPPKWAHDGVAVGECMTCSIGFRSPGQNDLVTELLGRMVDGLDENDLRYADPHQTATTEPGRIPEALGQWIIQSVREVLKDDASITLALGESLTEPKPTVYFHEQDETALRVQGVYLDAGTRIAYDHQRAYINGVSWEMADHDAQLMRSLANHRTLTTEEVASATPDMREWLLDALNEGWLHYQTEEDSQ